MTTTLTPAERLTAARAALTAEAGAERPTRATLDPLIREVDAAQAALDAARAREGL